MMSGTGFEPQAAPTARAARGLAMGQAVAVAAHFCQRILAPQLSLERAVGVSQTDRAHPPLRAGDKQASQRRSRRRIVDGHPRASFAVGCRRHPQARRGALVEPAARAVAGLVERPRDPLALADSRLEALQASRLLVLARADAHPALEGPPQKIRTGT